ncbi:MAG: TolC family protein, partial [Pirellulaceae bacterium]|nr:TolC family protein [Pirellulaceae bacterium]
MPAGSLPSPMNSSTDRESYTIDEQSGAGIGLVLLPIPKEAWEAIPAKCRTRMLEFESVLVEYRRTYERGPEPGELDQSPRFALEDIIDTAQLDSREYQSQKETLYSVAMRLSLERFDYDLKFSTGGNRTATNYSHARDAGVTVNGLGIPTSVQADKMLATSADLLARFSNGVVMTFNGPSGFAADVGSDLLLDISQTVFQRDGRFERLTQSERDVIYAARGFHRFRKTFFSDLTSQYYTLLRNYRGIEIESQNYFTLVREFQQRSEEQQQGFAPLLEVDQLEQNVLNARRTLVSDCNNQERALDALKIRIGLPTETPINLNLTELEGLTLRDKLAVTGELIGRVRGRIAAERSNQEPSRVQLVSSNIALLDRILEFYSQQRDLGISAPDSGPLELQRLRLRTDVARMEVEEDRHLVQAERDADEPNITVMLQRSRDLIEGLSHLQGRQLEYAAKKLPGTSFIEQENRSDELQQQVTLLDQTVSDIFDSVELAQLRLLVDRVAGL